MSLLFRHVGSRCKWKLHKNLRFISNFSVVDLQDKGRGIIANKALLAGDVVFSEKALIQVCDTSNIDDMIPSIYESFNKMTSHEKTQFMGLYSPSTVDQTNNLYIQKWSNFLMRQNPDQKFDFAKFVTVCMFNPFGTEKSTTIYDFTSRLCHSCSPNVILKHDEDRVSWIAAAPVSAGCELTISYLGDDDLHSTPQRRRYLQQSKEFLCQCIRCSALGDDTRQFNCSDKTCSGRHYVCQPLATDQPYLLPCSECSRSPSEDFIHRSLRSEKKLHNLANFLGKKHKKSSITTTEEQEPIVDIKAEVSRVLHSSYHPYHALFDPALKKFARYFSKTRKWKQLIRVAHDMVRAHESRPVVISDKATDLYALAGGYLAQCGAISEHSAELPVALECLRKALQVHLILNDRETLPDSKPLEKMIQSILSLLPPQPVNQSLCAFCHESPSSTYMPKSLRDETEATFFCCEGCQKAFGGVVSVTSSQNHQLIM